MFTNVKNANAAEETEATPSLSFPKPLNQTIRTNLTRPIKSRSKKEKEDEEEVLIIEVESKRDVYSNSTSLSTTKTMFLLRRIVLRPNMREVS
ncbi:Aureusidin synthase [Bienertia sinuspersici]